MRDHTFHPLRVARVVRETADTSSFVLDVPDDLAATFSYEPGQFCTFRVAVEGTVHIRCYSMSSAPAVGEPLQVTVKRVPGGSVSNWLNDHVGRGDLLEVAAPAGIFQLTASHGDLVAFAGGSGITPVVSLVKTALATTPRRVRLLYANRDRDSVIFRAALDELSRTYGDRLRIVHHLDETDGYVGPEDVRSLLAGAVDADVYICGPTPFMDVVEQSLVDAGTATDRIHIERFTPEEPDALDAVTATADGTMVTIDLDGRVETVEHREGTTILQTARQMGMTPPFSCESGSCATCMGRVVEGSVSMRTNNALTADEVDEGWILTCQSVPTSTRVHVVYGYD